MQSLAISWQQVMGMPPIAFDCGYCGKHMSTSSGWSSTFPEAVREEYAIYICTHCRRPTFINHAVTNSQTPGRAFGGPIESTPSSVEALYNEARDRVKPAAYTSAVLACRKLLMNIAVERGASARERNSSNTSSSWRTKALFRQAARPGLTTSGSKATKRRTRSI